MASANVTVKYHIVEQVTMPIATLSSGAEVPEGTTLELYTSTPGAVIYYTTDGSCPCDEEKRIRYDGPITLTESVTIQFIAVCEGMTDSEVVTLVLNVTPDTGVASLNAQPSTLNEYYDLRGARVLPPLRQGMYIHVRRSATGTTSRKVLIK